MPLPAKKSAKKFKIPLAEISVPSLAYHAKRTDHISTRMITAIHVGPFFGVHKGKTDFALLNADAFTTVNGNKSERSAALVASRRNAI
jgi:hypothetical protein